MDEVVGDRHIRQGFGEALVFEHVRLDDLGACVGEVLRLLGRARDRADGLAALEQFERQLATDVAGGADHGKEASRLVVPAFHVAQRTQPSARQPYLPPVISLSFAWS